MKVKVIAIKRINKTEPGGELLVRENVANALVKLGKVRYAEVLPDVPKPQKTLRIRRPRTPAGNPVGAVTRADAVGVAPPAARGREEGSGEGITERPRAENAE